MIKQKKSGSIYKYPPRNERDLPKGELQTVFHILPANGLSVSNATEDLFRKLEGVEKVEDRKEISLTIQKERFLERVVQVDNYGVEEDDGTLTILTDVGQIYDDLDQYLKEEVFQVSENRQVLGEAEKKISL